MKTSDAITWVFQHPELSVAVTGGFAILLLALSIWGIRRTLRRRKNALLPLNTAAGPALHDVADAARAAARRADNDDNTAEAPPGKENEPGTATLEPARIGTRFSAGTRTGTRTGTGAGAGKSHGDQLPGHYPGGVRSQFSPAGQ